MAVTETAGPVPVPAKLPKPAGRIGRFARTLIRSPKGLSGFVMVLLVIITAVAAPWIAQHDPGQQIVANRFAPPAWAEGGSTEHLFGGDNLGRDVLSRTVYGARTSVVIASIVLCVI